MPSSNVKLEYYQPAGKIVVTLYEKNLDESKLNIACEAKMLRVTVGERVLLNTSLYGEVIPDEVVYVVKPQKVEITMKKREERMWDTLEDKHLDEKQAKKAPTDKWTALVREVEEEEAEANDVHGVFQKIYRNCDEEAKRAMIKSYTESNGTVLSTNWADIKQKKTECKPPEDMEYRAPEI